MNNYLIKSSNVIIATILLFLIVCCENNEFPPSEYEIGQVSLGSAYEICVQDDYAYVTHNDGLAIIDISDVTNPKKVKNYKTNETPIGILVENDLAFIGSDKLEIVDISNKYNPNLISEFSTSGTIYGLYKNKNTLYISTWNGYFYIVDISDISSPNILSTLDCQGRGTDLFYQNDKVYYANTGAQKGLQIIDVSNNQSLSITTLAPGSYGAWDIHIENEYVFLGKHNEGFSIYQIHENGNLTNLAHRDEGGEVYGIYPDGNRLYIADLQDGVEVWDISDIQYPQLSNTIDEYSPHDLTVYNGLVFLADQDRDFVILDLENI